MPNCCHCNKKFHACSSCGLNHDWEWKYCSYNCWRESDDGKRQEETIGKIKEFVDSLSLEQRIFIYRVLSDDDVYDFLLDEITLVLKDTGEIDV